MVRRGLSRLGLSPMACEPCPRRGTFTFCGRRRTSPSLRTRAYPLGDGLSGSGEIDRLPPGIQALSLSTNVRQHKNARVQFLIRVIHSRDDDCEQVRGGTMATSVAERRIDEWKQKLIDPSRRNRLIYLGVLAKRGQLTRPSFGVLRTFGASRVPGSLPVAEVPRYPQAQSLALGMCQLLPQS